MSERESSDRERETVGREVYIGSSFSLKDRVQHVYETLTEAGHVVPDVWWDESREQADLKVLDLPDEEWYEHPKVMKRALRHWETIEQCDVFVLVAPEEGTKKFNGANLELGYAFGTGSICYSVGRLERSAMYIGPDEVPVRQVESAEELLEALESVRTWGASLD